MIKKIYLVFWVLFLSWLSDAQAMRCFSIFCYDDHVNLSPRCFTCKQRIQCNDFCRCTECGLVFHRHCHAEYQQIPYQCPSCNAIVDQIRMIKYNEINQLADSLMTGYFFEQQLDLLLVAAAMWNRIKIVRMLVDNCAVSLAGVQKALEAVQNKGNSQGVALLQAAWDIRTGGDVGTALQLAATYALNTTVGKMLESSVPFTERTIDDALIAAAQARAYDSFCLLYADKRASSVGKQYALQCACRNGLIQRRGDVFALLDDPLDIAC